MPLPLPSVRLAASSHHRDDEGEPSARTNSPSWSTGDYEPHVGSEANAIRDGGQERCGADGCRDVIDVAFTRVELRQADIAVVVDVLRATSTATQALAAGYRRVLCAESIERARQLRGRGRVLAGERQCVMPPGFDQGNSPREAIVRRGDELVLATTNGAPTIVAATQHAPRVLLACLLNLGAVARALRWRGRGRKLDVQIVCSGTDGAVALEDVYAAGRLSAALPGHRTDAARIAGAVARAFETPLEALAASADAAALTQANLSGDIGYCALESQLDVVPAVIAAGTGMAVIADLDGQEDAQNAAGAHPRACVG